MKKALRIILIVLIVVIIGGLGYLKFALPDVGDAPDLTIKATPEQVAHGEYLANHITVCMDCHSTRDWSRFSGPLVRGTLGKGGEYFGPEMGFPGKFYSKNITPANLKNWTDGEIFRTITTGVDKAGKALFPVMPYPYYGKMDPRDVYDIIAYIRTLAPIENKTPEHDVDFPLNFIINTIPVRPAFVKRPEKQDTLKYGAYLVNMAACMECHTQAKKGTIIPELAFSGGREFEMPGGTVRSANISPDMETGIGAWSAEAFIHRFKMYENEENLPTVKPSEMNTIMPWSMYAGMDSSDLRSIYTYLRTIKPIKNMVTKYSPSPAK